MAAQPSAATLGTLLQTLNRHEPDLTTLGPLGELKLERALEDAKNASQALHEFGSSHGPRCRQVDAGLRRVREC